MKEIIIRVRVDDDGNVISTKTETKDLISIDEYMNDGYHTLWFDESCMGWTEYRDYNAIFLKHQEDYMNAKLEIQGYLMLNEVYDMIGLPRTKRGMIDGYDYAKGDRVDFGLYKKEKYLEDSSNFELDFNVRENIFGLYNI